MKIINNVVVNVDINVDILKNQTNLFNINNICDRIWENLTFSHIFQNQFLLNDLLRCVVPAVQV